jgi:hypothetical protein
MKRFRIWLLNLHTNIQKTYKQDRYNPMAFCTRIQQTDTTA